VVIRQNRPYLGISKKKHFLAETLLLDDIVRKISPIMNVKCNFLKHQKNRAKDNIQPYLFLVKDLRQSPQVTT